MKKFSEIEYVRPDMEAEQEKVRAYTKALKEAKSYEELRGLFMEEKTREDAWATMAEVAQVRYTVDTRDSFYEGEVQFWNETIPAIHLLIQKAEKVILESPFIKVFAEEFGEFFVKNMEVGHKLADDCMVEDLIDEAKDIQEEIDTTFTRAYACLQRANIQHGISKVEELAYTVPIEDSIQIQTRSIMGTEIPYVKYDAHENQLTYAMDGTFESIDIAREAFRQVKDLTIKLSMVENAAYRLATSIKKTQKRANALKNITIPTYTGLVYKISNELEEKEREEFTRLKVIKRMKQKG